ncbi:MAG: hypothetical protein ACXWLH_04605 [Candidatus Saccharimonadales bacterium]
MSIQSRSGDGLGSGGDEPDGISLLGLAANELASDINYVVDIMTNTVTDGVPEFPIDSSIASDNHTIFVRQDTERHTLSRAKRHVVYDLTDHIHIFTGINVAQASHSRVSIMRRGEVSRQRGSLPRILKLKQLEVEFHDSIYPDLGFMAKGTDAIFKYDADTAKGKISFWDDRDSTLSPAMPLEGESLQDDYLDDKLMAAYGTVKAIKSEANVLTNPLPLGRFHQLMRCIVSRSYDPYLFQDNFVTRAIDRVAMGN